MTEPEDFPRTIGRYEIKRLLGAGAMGSVYLAEDPRIKRQLAIKVVKLDAIRNEADRKEFLARFQREAEVSGVLNDPGIVTIYDVGDSEVGPFLAMEFVKGHPLDAIIKRGDPLPIQTKLKIIAGVASALDHAHAHGITHRDVKPGNVMITEDWRPKLMDFGIAKREDATLTQTGTFLGTPSYASPEQIKEGRATILSDVFSFGVMTFELLSGTIPFPGNSINTILYRIVNEPPVEVKVAGVVPEGWQRIFNRCLAKNPQERYPSCLAFVTDLIHAATELPEKERVEMAGALKLAGPQGPAPADATVLFQPAAKDLAPPAASRKPLLAAVGGGVALLLVAGGFLLFRKGGGERILLSTVPAEAAILRDGKELGKTPMPLDLKPGEKVVLQRKGFKPFEFVAKAGEAAPRLTLEPVISEVALRTEPAGAMVVLDGAALAGVTPLTVRKWNQGESHDLTFTTRNGLMDSNHYLAGEFPEKDKIFVLRGASEPPRVSAIPKTVDVNAPATVHSSGGYGVKVWVDGRPAGEVPAGGKFTLAPGTHKVELQCPAYFFRETRTLTVTAGQSLNLALPDLANLTVSTHPSSGIITVDGIRTDVESDGSAPVRLTKGRHAITVMGKRQDVDVVQDNQQMSFHN
jgi:tRNA A-37 threonylcarbamoyl transferase component Bud32